MYAHTAPGPRCLSTLARSVMASLAVASRRAVAFATSRLASSSAPLRKPNGSAEPMVASVRSSSSVPSLPMGPNVAASCTAAVASRQMLCETAARGSEGSIARSAATRYAVTAAGTIAPASLRSRTWRRPSASAMRVAPRSPPRSRTSNVGMGWRSTAKSQRLHTMACASGCITLRSARSRISAARAASAPCSAVGATRISSIESCRSSGTERAPALARARSSAALRSSAGFSLPSAIFCSFATRSASSCAPLSFDLYAESRDGMKILASAPVRPDPACCSRRCSSAIAALGSGLAKARAARS